MIPMDPWLDPSLGVEADVVEIWDRGVRCVVIEGGSVMMG
jgi:hypothetical protein